MNAAKILQNLYEVKQQLKRENIHIVTDSNVYELYLDLFTGKSVSVIPSGEQHKNLDTVGKIISDMIKSGCNRKSTVVAIGGGVTGDTAGFAAACFMRGVKWINIPTTLLAMVDSGIGGKTGVDVGGYKNVAGAFLLPEEVYICYEFLQTLPEREWLCGCGEMVKHALLNNEIWQATKANIDKLIARDETAYTDLIKKSARYKESVVRADFKEAGLRKRLNVGHTVGHAIENLDGFKLSHGEYVALGIVAEISMFKERVPKAYFDEVVALARKVCRHSFPKISTEEITAASQTDKKNVTGKIVIMLPVKEGEVEEMSITPEEFKERLEKCKSDL